MELELLIGRVLFVLTGKCWMPRLDAKGKVYMWVVDAETVSADQPDEQR